MKRQNSNRLSAWRKGQKGTVVAIEDPGIEKKAPDATSAANRLLEMGLVEGSPVEVVHEAPFGGDPFAIRIRNSSLLALNRSEAKKVIVEEG